MPIKNRILKKMFKKLFIVAMGIFATQFVYSTVYTVNTRALLISRMTAALPGDTVIVADGSYNWGQVNFINNNGTSTSAWIVLKSQTAGGVEFNGTTYFQFKGTRVELNGFNFANGNAGTNPIISFRYNSSTLSNYCRVTNMLFDNYNTYSSDSTLENEWVGVYGTNNRLDHCSFINKYNARATVVVWYSTTTYPNPAISTYHRIDSNYFKGRSFQGANGGETIRVGDSNSSRTDGFNTVEYNLFQDNFQVEPEIISNKSDFNVYRYNTFKNSDGGLTLRHGRYCSVYGNFFIVDNPARTKSYGVRVIDKGHRVYNNYFEGLLGNKNSLTALRCPIILYNGRTTVIDSADATKASGYFPAEDAFVAFNTIVNCSGGAGIVMGFRDGGSNTFEPQGLTVANNIIKMTTGQASYKDAANLTLTYTAEGNMYSAPSGLGLSSATGFANTTLTFGTRADGILGAPAVVQDAAINTSSYSPIIVDGDAQSKIRSAVYDVGAQEINGTGAVLTFPLDSSMVGAVRPTGALPIKLNAFNVLVQSTTANLSWLVSNEINVKEYLIEKSSDGIQFATIDNLNVNANSSTEKAYSYQDKNLQPGKYFYRLKIVDNDSKFQYSGIKFVVIGQQGWLNIFPNPATDLVTVYVKGAIDPTTQIVLVDALGKKVKQQKVVSNQNNIILSGLAKGVYNIQLIQNKKTIAVNAILIQ